MPMRSFFFMTSGSRVRLISIRRVQRIAGVTQAGTFVAGIAERNRRLAGIPGDEYSVRLSWYRAGQPGENGLAMPVSNWRRSAMAGLGMATLAAGCGKRQQPAPAPAPAMKPAPQTPIDTKRAEIGGPMWDPAWDKIVEEALPPEMLSAQVSRAVRPLCPRFNAMGEADKR